MVLAHFTSPLCDLYLYVKFEVTSFYTLEVMPGTKIQSKNLQREITLKIDGIELWFLYTALLLNEIYMCVKSEVTSLYTLEVMPQPKIHKVYKG